MRTLLKRWPRSRGLTMIELLTVVALLALIVALVVAFMFPSDDRRVKQEAEKLAAYCEAAGGEAKMAEGAVRVVLTFEDGVYKREQARVGARITDLAWTEDEKMRAEKVRAPVKIAAVQVADAGTLESGTGWLVWEDTKTRGGVVVLQLNEAIWSVIVDPATGQVRIERGRAELPNAGKGFKRTFARPELLGLTDGTTVSPDQLARALDLMPTSMPPEYAMEGPGSPGQVVVINQPPVQRWSPGLAAVLSFFLPGLGQLYKGQIINGIVWFFMVMCGYAALILPGVVLHFFCVLGALSGNPWSEGKTTVVRQ